MRPHIATQIRQAVITRAQFRCEYCLVHEDDFYLSGEIDHIQPIKFGGITVVENLAYSCIHCNRNKGYIEAVLLKGKPTRLYNPRIDFWYDHFEFQGVVIIAKTEIAEATTQVLKMNAEVRIREREIFVVEGTYPPHPLPFPPTPG